MHFSGCHGRVIEKEEPDIQVLERDHAKFCGANCFSGAMASVNTWGMGLSPNGHTVYQNFCSHNWKAKYL